MHERLISLYRFVLRAGNRQLAERLSGILGADPVLRERADMALQELPRGPARWSAAGERVLRRLLERLEALLR